MLRKIRPLKKGDKVAILSTARKISYTEIEEAVQLLESWGLLVEVGETIGLEYHQFAGTDIERAKEFQTMMDRSDIAAIICARGGYGTIRIMEHLDFTQFLKNPCWVVGYSDVCILHAHINNYLGVQSLHSTMPINIPGNTKDAIETLRAALFGENYSIKFGPHPLNKSGEVTADLIGGNLSILYSIMGTSSGFNPTDRILFLEDLDEYLYHIDRMMMALKRGGKLSGIAALIVGGMSDMNDNTIPFGSTAEEIIAEKMKSLDVPLCFNFPAGHIKDNHALLLGAKAKLLIDKSGCSLEFRQQEG